MATHRQCNLVNVFHFDSVLALPQPINQIQSYSPSFAKSQFIIGLMLIVRSRRADSTHNKERSPLKTLD